MITAQEKNNLVMAVLLAAKEPLGPTEIARRVAHPWFFLGCDGQSSAISPVLKRIGAVRHNGGKYTMPRNGGAT